MTIKPTWCERTCRHDNASEEEQYFKHKHLQRKIRDCRQRGTLRKKVKE